MKQKERKKYSNARRSGSVEVRRMYEYVATKAGSLQQSSWVLIALFPLLVAIGCQTQPIKHSEVTITQDVERLPEGDLEILDYKYFVINYDKKYRLARSVVYTLTDTQLKNSRPGTRKDSFRQDTILRTLKAPVVKVDEYKNTNYDKGHLANSADFTFSDEANRATFVMSNMVPQTPNLNREAWAALEEQVRLWACGEQKVTIITGPILKDNLPTLPSGLPIPEEFFKIIIDETPPQKILAFVYKQSDNKNTTPQNRVTSIASLKQKTNHQFSITTIPSYPTEPLDKWTSKDCITKGTQ